MKNKIIFWICLWAIPALANPLAQHFSFDGVLLDSSSNPITTTQTVTFTVFDPGAACMLYEETQSVTPDSSGNFSVKVGNGTPTGNNPGLTFKVIFQNKGQVRSAGSNCAGGYTPAAGDGRKLRVTVGATQLTPDFDMTPVPMANVAETVQGLAPADLIQVGTGNLTQADIQTVFAAGNYTELIALLNGTSTKYATKSANTGASLPTYTTASPPSTPVAGSMWYDSTSNVVKFYNGSATQTLSTGGAGTVTSVATGTGLTGGPITTSGTISLDVSGVTAGTYPKVTVDTYGRVTAGTALAVGDLPASVVKHGGNALAAPMTVGTTDAQSLSLLTNSASALHITSAGDVGIGTLTPGAKLDVQGTIKITGGTPAVGKVLTSDASGNATWQSLSGYSSNTIPNTWTTGDQVIMTSNVSQVGLTVKGIASQTASLLKITDDANNPIYSFGPSTMATNDVTSTFTVADATINSANPVASIINNDSTSGQGNGFSITAGNDAGDHSLSVYPRLGGAPSLLVRGDGKVGMGTASPNEQLHVVTTAPFPLNIDSNSAVVGMKFTRNGPSTSTISSSQVSGFDVMEVDIANDSIPEFTVQRNGSLGRIGVNSSQPSGFLEVKADATGKTIVAGSYSATSTQASILDLQRGKGTPGSPAAVGAGDAIGAITFSAYDGTSFSGPSARISSVATEAQTAGTHGGKIVFETVPNGSSSLSARMVISDTGNVGIGNASPGTLLELGTAGSIPGYIRLNGGTSGFVGIQGQAAAGAWVMTLPNSAGTPGQFLQTDGSGNTTWGNGDSLGNHTANQNLNMNGFPIFGSSAPSGSLTLESTSHGTKGPIILNPTSGNVGIGTVTPSYALHVVGTAGLSTGTAWTNASDIRLKDVHGDYEYGLNEILQLHTVRFSYKEGNAMGLPSDHKMTGFIAQEVQKVIPDAVTENKQGYLQLNADPIHWAVVNSIKELYQKVVAVMSSQDKFAQEIALLKQENATLKQYLCEKDPSASFCL